MRKQILFIIQYLKFAAKFGKAALKEKQILTDNIRFLIMEMGITIINSNCNRLS